MAGPRPAAVAPIGTQGRAGPGAAAVAVEPGAVAVEPAGPERVGPGRSYGADQGRQGDEDPEYRHPGLALERGGDDEAEVDEATGHDAGTARVLLGPASATPSGENPARTSPPSAAAMTTISTLCLPWPVRYTSER